MNKINDGSKKVAILYVGFLFPDMHKQRVNNQTYPQAATQRFGEALISTLKYAFEGDAIEIISVAPINDYPNNKLIIAPSGKWKFNGINAKLLSFVNVIILKHLTRFINTYFNVLKWSIKNSKSKRIIISHGLVSSQLWAVIAGNFFYKSILCAYLTDATGVPLFGEIKLVSYLRRIDRKIILAAIQRMSGVLAMTDKLAKELASGLPASIIPTIYNFNPILSFLEIKKDKSLFNIVFSGGLNKDNGVDILLLAFNQVRKDNWRLIIAGKGDMEKEVIDAAANDVRIEYKGFIEIEQLSALYKAADVFINLRLPYSSISELGFPSKLLEYVGTGKPVISTNLSTLPNELRKHLIILESVDIVSELIESLVRVQLFDRSQKEECLESAKRIIEENFLPERQSIFVKSFLISLDK